MIFKFSKYSQNRVIAYAIHGFLIAEKLINNYLKKTLAKAFA